MRGPKIGEGSFGVVYKGRIKGRDEEFAIKVLHGPPSAALREVKIMAKLMSHPNLLSIKAMVVEPFMLVSELAQLGDLKNLLDEVMFCSLESLHKQHGTCG